MCGVFVFIALVSVSEEVRSRCHIKHSLPRYTTESLAQNNYLPDSLQAQSQSGTSDGGGSSNISVTANRRQKSWDLLDQSALAQARHKQPMPQQVNHTFISTICYKLPNLNITHLTYTICS